MEKPIDVIIKEHIVEELVSAYGVPHTYKDDLIQHIYIILLEYDQNKLNELIKKKQIRFYIARIIRNQWFSTTSTFYMLYRKFNQLNDEYATPKEEPNIIEKIDE